MVGWVLGAKNSSRKEGQQEQQTKTKSKGQILYPGQCLYVYLLVMSTCRGDLSFISIWNLLSKGIKLQQDITVLYLSSFVISLTTLWIKNYFLFKMRKLGFKRLFCPRSHPGRARFEIWTRAHLTPKCTF